MGAGVSASMWEDEPVDRHTVECKVWLVDDLDQPCDCGADEDPADMFQAGYADQVRAKYTAQFGEGFDNLCTCDVEETWLPVAAFRGAYEVSSLGRVRSLNRVVGGVGGSRRTIQGRILSLEAISRGYQTVTLCLGGSQTTFKVHRLVLTAFHPEPVQDGMLALHGDGDCLHNCAGNLRWGSRQENSRDALRHGTHAGIGRTHCPLGHELIEENLANWKRTHGTRHCLACSRAHGRRASARRRGVELEIQPLADKYWQEIQGSINGGGYPIDDPLEDLLRPDAGTLADRLEDLGRRIYPRDTDGVA